MIEATSWWEDAFKKPIVPHETMVELSCEFRDITALDEVTITGINESMISKASNLKDEINYDGVATLEHNSWAFGTNDIYDPRLYFRGGYISDRDPSEGAGVILTFPEPRTLDIPGIVIGWDNLRPGYATKFSVTAYNGDKVVAAATIDNEDNSSRLPVDLPMRDYDRIEIRILEWSIPNHRVRIEYLMLGRTIVFTNTDLLSYSHEMSGDLVSMEVSQNKISFVMNNIDGRWNPANPAGIGRYLSERQKIEVRYGMRETLSENTYRETMLDVGEFYLSSWETDDSTFGVRIEARDPIGFLTSKQYESETNILSTFLNVALTVDGMDFYPTVESNNNTLSRLLFGFTMDDFENPEFTLDDILPTTATLEEGYTAAMVAQLVANAVGGILCHETNGSIKLRHLSVENTGYTIPLSLSKSYPQITLSKPIKSIAVKGAEGVSYELTLGSTGETQTVTNPLIPTEEHAAFVAVQTKEALETRQTVSGVFRADPRLQLFDVVGVETTYGKLKNVALTKIRYEYTGSFWCAYEGRAIIGAQDFILDKSTLGKDALAPGVLLDTSRLGTMVLG